MSCAKLRQVPGPAQCSTSARGLAYATDPTTDERLDPSVRVLDVTPGD